ncbi:MAG: hypothetical protein U1F11_13475 [Steroidobacteraceae bacterium]
MPEALAAAFHRGRSALLLTLAALAIAACAGTPPAPRVQGPRLDDAGTFCAAVQQLIVGTRLEAHNVIHPEFQAFVLSKPVARPLETEQFTAIRAGTDRPYMINCKMKTADHLQAEYGAAAAGEDIGCSGVHRRLLADALASLSRAERRRARFDGGRAVSFEPDAVTTQGDVFVADYDVAWTGADGRLHLLSKAMRNEWLDPRYVNAPVKFRGTRYCRLAAPAYLRDLLTGAATAPARP